MALVVDTGPLVALLDRSDERHEACVELLSDPRTKRVLPAPILPEVDYWCRDQGKSAGFVRLLGDVRAGAFVVEDLRSEDYDRVAEILSTYADLRVGFVDAAVLAVVERLGEPKLATLDHRHFAALRPRHVEALELLPAL